MLREGVEQSRISMYKKNGYNSIKMEVERAKMDYLLQAYSR